MTIRRTERDPESIMKKLVALTAALLLVGATWAVQDGPVGVILNVDGTVRVTGSDGQSREAGAGTRVSATERIVPASGGSALLVLRGGERVEVTEEYAVPSPGASSEDGDMFSRASQVLGRVASTNTENLADRQGMIRPIPGEPVLVAPRNELAVMSPRPTFTWYGVNGASGYTLQIRQPGERPRRFEGIPDTTFTYPEDAPPLAHGEEYWWTVAPAGSGRATREQRFSVVDGETYQQVKSDLRSLEDAGLDPEGDGAFLAAVVHWEAGLYYEAARTLEKLEASGEAMSADAYLLKGDVMATMGRLEAAREAFDRADEMRR